MNNDLKNRFKQYRQEPDAEVWSNIEQKVAKRKAWRRVGLSSAAGLVLAVAIVLTLQPKSTTPKVAENVKPNIVLSAPSTTATDTIETVVDAEPEATPTVSPTAVSTVQNLAVETLTTSNLPITMEIAIEEKPLEVELPEHTNAVADQHPTKEIAEPMPAAPSETANLVADEPIASQPITSSIALDTVKVIHLYIPNIFYPKSDEPTNRVFKVISRAEVKNYSIYIYNRGGRQVYHSRNINEAWDGTANGTALPQGAYVYAISYIDHEGKPQSEKGTVMLVR